MRIPPDSPRGQKIWLSFGRFIGYWTMGVIALAIAAFVVLLVLHFTGVIELADS